MTPDVHCDAPRECRAQHPNAVDSNDVVQKRAELDGPLGNPCTAVPDRRRVRTHVKCAASREYDDVIEVRERTHEPLEHRSRLALESRVGRRLSATGGTKWYFDVDAKTLEHLERRNRRAWIELVHITRREERDRHGGRLVTIRAESVHALLALSASVIG